MRRIPVKVERDISLSLCRVYRNKLSFGAQRQILIDEPLYSLTYKFIAFEIEPRRCDARFVAKTLRFHIYGDNHA